MGTSEVDTDIRSHNATVIQVEMQLSFTSDQGISQYHGNQQPQPPQQAKSLYIMNPLIIGKFHRHSFTNARIFYSRLYTHLKWEPVK